MLCCDMAGEPHQPHEARRLLHRCQGRHHLPRLRVCGERLLDTWLYHGFVTTKIDVFAFGDVVLLELVTGREAVNEDGESLWSEAERVFGSGKGEIRVEENGLLQWMDMGLVEQSCPVESVVSVMNVAMACLRRDPSKQPSMVEAMYMLSKADEHFSDYSGDHGVSVHGGDVAAR
ncbi:hypothetical protein Cni_G02692 [Canna indica]|uniref:Serine-threonine/tyrosine-protein kinase catalytic domain-containing protein n=1 Tax=Canna indica TaxID=4628 RepID=A0AAQ3JQJ9_9LILI|nr:hypothetical protein Cni_G02692 [Canna indica]